MAWATFVLAAVLAVADAIWFVQAERRLITSTEQVQVEEESP
jgi:hypothetical protein